MKILHTCLFIIVILLAIVIKSNAKTQDSIYEVKITGMIDNGLAKYVQRSIHDAESTGAEGIIFHIDTFGGLVEAADEIRKSILNTPIPTVAFINKNAASAGALISLACDSLYMAPGASIGAATVIEGNNGKKASEKMQSYMRGLMRSTAEATGRNPKIAEAMVDETISVAGIIGSDKLLTLSANEAVQNNIAQAELSNINQVKSRMGWSNTEIVHMDQRWDEELLRFLANPVVSSILMLMMLGGLYFELHSPGIGFPGTIAAIGALLFFAPLYIMGLAQSWEIVLFIVGVILIILEIFVIPGFGITGISGIILVVFSLGSALIGNVGLEFPAIDHLSRAIWTMAITLVLAIALFISIARYIPSNKYLGRLVLSARSGSGSEPGINEIYTNGESELLNAVGETITPLRPSGMVIINGKRVDVVSEGTFIDKGQQVKVIDVIGSRIVVARNT